MKHPASRAFHARWQALRQRTGEPANAARGVGPQLVSYAFAVAGAAESHALREVGTGLRSLIGPDAEGRPFPALFAPDSRAALADLLAIVAEEALPAVAGVAARAGRRTVALELTLLPPLGPRATAGSLSGLMVPFTAPRPAAALAALALTSWRHLHPPPGPLPPRALRKVGIASGVTLYEGRT